MQTSSRQIWAIEAVRDADDSRIQEELQKIADPKVRDLLERIV